MVEWNQTTLLNHTIREAAACENLDLYLALGANLSSILPTIPKTITKVIVKGWKNGMGFTISDSFHKIPFQEYEALIISMCDQPYISKAVFNALIEKYQIENSKIVISKYNVSSGPPTLFHKSLFPKLQNLKGDEGAKNIVKEHRNSVSTIDFKKGNIDIDTEEDLKNLPNT